MSVQQVIDGLKSILAEFSPLDMGDFGSEVAPGGSVYVSVGTVEQIAPGIPDWRLGITVAGQTLADDDPGKEKANALFTAVGTVLNAQTPATLSAATGGQCELWIFTSAVAPNGDDGRVFTIGFDLTIQNFQP